MNEFCFCFFVCSSDVVNEGRGRSLERSMCLDLDNNSPEHSSEQYLYDNLCYATTPSSSNENSDMPSSSDEVAPSRERDQDRDQQSPTSRLLQEYEAHLRSALARGLDAESYSLHTFEALLTQSMENVGEYLTKCVAFFFFVFSFAFVFIRSFVRFLIFQCLFFNFFIFVLLI